MRLEKLYGVHHIYVCMYWDEYDFWFYIHCFEEPQALQSFHIAQKGAGYTIACYSFLRFTDKNMLHSALMR